MKKNNLIFVYGSLRAASSHPMSTYFRRNSEFISKAYILGTLYDLGEYPGVVVRPDSLSRVYGELYRIKEKYYEEVIERLDYYEGYDPDIPDQSEFIRTTIHVFTDQGVCESQVYLYTFDNIQNEIESGDYFDRDK